MDWVPNEKEILSVLALDGDRRYLYLVKKVADQEEIWSLWHEGGWAVALDDAGRQSVPVWPHSRYATLCAHGAWEGYEPKIIPLDVWLDRWSLGLREDRRFVGAFPRPDGQGVLIEPQRFEQDLRKEISQY